MVTMTRPNRRLLLLALGLSYITLGMLGALPAVSLIRLASNTHVSLEVAGSMFTLSSIGGIFGAVLSGSLIRSTKPKYLLMLGLFLVGSAALCRKHPRALAPSERPQNSSRRLIGEVAAFERHQRLQFIQDFLIALFRQFRLLAYCLNLVGGASNLMFQASGAHAQGRQQVVRARSLGHLLRLTNQSEDSCQGFT